MEALKRPRVLKESKQKRQWALNRTNTATATQKSKEAHQLPWDRNIKSIIIINNMRQEPTWLKVRAILIYYTCKEKWNKGLLQIQGIWSNKHIPRPHPTLKHSLSIPTHPSPKQPPTTTTQTPPTHSHTHPDKTGNKQVTFPLHATRINKYINR